MRFAGYGKKETTLFTKEITKEIKDKKKRCESIDQVQLVISGELDEAAQSGEYIIRGGL
jgi:hypothetical protein